MIQLLKCFTASVRRNSSLPSSVNFHRGDSALLASVKLMMIAKATAVPSTDILMWRLTRSPGDQVFICPLKLGFNWCTGRTKTSTSVILQCNSPGPYSLKKRVLKPAPLKIQAKVKKRLKNCQKMRAHVSSSKLKSTLNGCSRSVSDSLTTPSHLSS